MNSSPLAAIWHGYPLLAWVACARFCSLPLGSLSYLNFYLKLRLDSDFSYGTGLTLNGHINVVEQDDALLFTNLGGFIPRSVEQVIDMDAPPDQYRNPFLAQAMVELNMIDTIGSGIRRVFATQRWRYFPLPDYDLSDPQRVKVR